MDECKPLSVGRARQRDGGHDHGRRVGGRGLHSSTFQLNVSAFHGIGGQIGGFQGVFTMC